ncbi:hypothetical protein AMTRI_Chr05g63760 [Amborella trichopoda]|uniref:Ribosomal RNA-processing protein 14/surfeit locus protein 6 C-terminal domain-containing protein n=1 Tax=Amborella trichopoda TaxID=13333 RepID=W1PB69_AMBTC|nr:surfeit locus protein 6 homolog [Amborella trichopoda]XP_011622907.1 surfeit locus protein 6 homolog [Amborella trichopoda]XP_020522147.1 surfeit locus protein 6 homolog [Amborella trichopoda]XP_020522148.1 surfeit locus protein 6 homolog [Amborella trichopoda]XP_020522149.1 surfeit locus protein 6 homolog [Amborella trichopoda]ERN04856.1 hypothetical protein AMTR_s00146p00077020 [Amborella trichopoda]|eukprot:XP_011622906.1 surfeit locus protein 6 homolog [Amborella trichopoda]
MEVLRTHSPNSDLKALIHENSLFFERLVELIPARFYLPNEDSEKKWFQGLSKAAKASAKKETKENIKKARRARLDPEASATTLDLLKQRIEKEKTENASEKDDEDEEGPVKKAEVKDDKSVTYEDLRERLHRRIEELRAQRNAGDKKPNAQKKEKRKNSGEGKRKWTQEQEDKSIKSNTQDGESSKKKKKASGDYAFTHVKIGSGEEQNKKKMKISKEQALVRAKKLEEAVKDPIRGPNVASKHSWGAAAKRAAGIKVHDDPKLIKQSIKKEKKRQQKNVQKWKGRLEARDKIVDAKQQTRANNIAQRAQEKKKRRIEKREKKLLRPGFEGRKVGFINK